MPQLQNAKKAHRQSLKRQAQNKTYKNRIKNLYRQISDLTKQGNKKEAINLLPTYYKTIDKAAQQNILPKNRASRKKSLVTRIASGVSQTPPKKVPASREPNALIEQDKKETVE
ncbi:MAG: hypothetical protein A3H51_02980 [Candidatus Spechtbacteria bacterium RIFCSPLOWO2_02_FULL_38_8]|uniref:Small ribosomal subunit protein bS20 n=1 Tax=Candidatus Spechtbacteria bacterium RIFCSPLOWO2_02_FULL_38_8 TaxID=1802164 RepID=A0A1G2HL36_9BACT|nr:MAG: hypothetical protein A3H51_02980 [Candidatus Spechtbacteria bacterium RIFCSPLOWO2_02_FULL_38_8]